MGKYLIAHQPVDVIDGMASKPKHDVIGTYRENRIDGLCLDVSDKSKVIDVLFSHEPDIIIHCAANGDVDSVESNSAQAVKSDLLGTIHLKEYAEKMKCNLITLSSNAVYEGIQPPYTESAPRKPVNFYGKIKSLADDIIIKSSCDWLIIRPILMYGWPYEHGRANWVTKIIEKLKAKDELSLVDDSFSQPVFAAGS